MPDWLPIALSMLGTAATLTASYFIARYAARRWMVLGGVEAQTKLNTTLRELANAYEEKLELRNTTITDLSAKFEACKDRLETVEGQERIWKRERRVMKQEISDLHDEVREVRRRAGLANA